MSSSCQVVEIKVCACGTLQRVYKRRLIPTLKADWGLPFYSTEGNLLTVVFRYEKATVAIDICSVEPREKLQTIELVIGSVGAKWFLRCPKLAIAYALSSKQMDGKTHTFPTLREPHFPWPYPKVLGWTTKILVSTRDYPGIELWDVVQKRTQETLMKDKYIHTYTVFCPAERYWAATLGTRQKFGMSAIPMNLSLSSRAPKEPSDWVRHEVFAPIGDWIAAGSREGTVYVWNFQNPEEPTLLTGHTDYVTSLAFSRDGKRLASGARDNTTRLWDVESGKQIISLPMDKPRWIMGIAFSPCGKIIAGGMGRRNSLMVC